MINVAILGGSGYTAAELIQLLLRHPHVNLAAITSRQENKEGSPFIADLHPRFRGRLHLACEPFEVDRLLAKGVQCVFSCLPHGASMSAVPQLMARGLRVIDLSADYRLRDANVFAQWYKESHADLASLAQAVYGLPEVYGEELPQAQLVANPGCYPQSAVLALAPLVAGQAIEFHDIVIDSKSGVSGAGRSPTLTTHFPECNESVAAYQVGTHRHTPEIEQTLSDLAVAPVQVLFTPHLIPMDRGIFTTIYATPRRSITQEQLYLMYREYYRAAPFIRITEALPATKDVWGSNFCDLSLRVAGRRIVILSCIDNLVRGASGVAVQNFNRMHGWDETLALL